MTTYIGLNVGAQVTRGWWRVTLAEGFDILGVSWPTKVARWRASVDAGEADIPAVTSPASIGPDPVFGSARAVVDVHILGANQGDIVGFVASRLNSLTRGVDVHAVQAISNSDPIGRSAALTDAVADARGSANPLERLTRLISTVGTVAIIGVALYVALKLLKATEK